MNVSVLIAVYNGAAFLAQAIESALEQSRPPDEVLVVDDGSTDSSAEIAARYGSPVVVLRQPHGGLPAARNHGIRQAQGDWIAFLDADDVWRPKKLELQLGVIEAGVGLVFTDKELFWNDGRPHQVERYAPGDAGAPLPALLDHFFASPSTVMLRKDLCEMCGGFLDDQEIADGDYDLWIRMAARTRFAHVAEPLVLYRKHPQQLTSIQSPLVRALEKIKPVQASREIFQRELGLTAWQLDRILLGKYLRFIRLAVSLRDPGTAVRLGYRALRCLLERKAVPPFQERTR